MQLSTALAFTTLVALSSTMPVDKRQDIDIDITITITTTIVVIDTVDVIATAWLPPAVSNKPNPAPVVHITPVEDAAPPAQATSPPVTQSLSQEAAQNQANQVQEQKNQDQEAKNQAAQEQAIQTQNQANQAQEQANNEKVAQNQAAQDQAAPAPTSSTPAAPVETPAALQTTQDTTSSGQTLSTSGGSCGETGGTCTATNVTYFGGGLGACGWTNDTMSEDFFALAHGAPALFPPSYSVPINSWERRLTLQFCRNDGLAIKWQPILWSYSSHRVPRQDYPWNFDRQMHGLRKLLPLWFFRLVSKTDKVLCRVSSLSISRNIYSINYSLRA